MAVTVARRLIRAAHRRGRHVGLHVAREHEDANSLDVTGAFDGERKTRAADAVEQRDGHVASPGCDVHRFFSLNMQSLAAPWGARVTPLRKRLRWEECIGDCHSNDGYVNAGNTNTVYATDVDAK